MKVLIFISVLYMIGQSAVRRMFMKPEPKSKGCSFTGLVTCSGDPSAFYVQEVS